MVKRRSNKRKIRTTLCIAKGEEPPDPVTATLVASLGAAAIGAGGAITSSVISKKKAAGATSGASSQLISEDTNTNKNGVIPLSTSPLGDTTTPALQRGKLLGN